MKRGSSATMFHLPLLLFFTDMFHFELVGKLNCTIYIYKLVQKFFAHLPSLFVEGNIDWTILNKGVVLIMLFTRKKRDKHN